MTNGIEKYFHLAYRYNYILTRIETGSCHVSCTDSLNLLDAMKSGFIQQLVKVS